MGLGLGFGLENKEGTTKQTWTSLTNRQTDRPTDRQTDQPDRVVSSPPPQQHVALCGEHCQQDVDTSPDSEKITSQ